MADRNSRIPSNRDAGGGELLRFVRIVMNSCKVFNDKLIKNNATFKKHFADFKGEHDASKEEIIMQFASPLCLTTLGRIRKAEKIHRDQMEDECRENFADVNNDEGYGWRTYDSDYSCDSDWFYEPELPTRSTTKKEKKSKKRKRTLDLKKPTDKSKLMFDYQYDPVKGLCLVCTVELKLPLGKSKSEQESRAKVWALHCSGSKHKVTERVFFNKFAYRLLKQNVLSQHISTRTQNALSRWADKRRRIVNLVHESTPSVAGGSTTMSVNLSAFADAASAVATNTTSGADAASAVATNTTTHADAASAVTHADAASAVATNTTTHADAASAVATNITSGAGADADAANAVAADTTTHADAASAVAANATTHAAASTFAVKKIKLETYWVGPYTSERTGKKYWHNTETKESAFSCPEKYNPVPHNDNLAITTLKTVKVETYWVGPYTSERTGKKYWYNTETKKSIFSCPEKYNPVPDE